MIRATIFRVLLAALLAIVSVTDGAWAQINANCDGPCPPPPPGPPHHHHNNTVWYVVGGVAVGVLGWLIGTKILGNRPPPDVISPPVDPTLASVPPPTLQANLPPSQGPGSGGSSGGGKGGGKGSGNGGGATTAQLRNGFSLPPAGVLAFVQDEVMLDVPASVPDSTLRAISARHNMTILETRTFRLTGRTLHRWRLDGGGTVENMIRGLSREPQVAGAQPIYLYRFAEEAFAEANGDQYAPEKLSLPEAHRLATGDRVLVAVIDSGVDARHPDLAGAIVGSFDAVADDTTPHPHGTGMAGAIAARRTVVSSAPRVGLLTIRAFSTKSNSSDATTFNIIKGLDWAAERGARVINMSFAGPPDPRLKDALAKASAKGIVLVAAAGNAGPKSPPLFPGADPHVIAVTATDIDDGLFAGANRGSYIAVSAPGVDVLVPAPDGTYQFTTGTSVASAEVSGVVALLLERNPSLTPADIKRILMRTARTLGPKGRERDFGAGLVNALAAVTAARTR